MFYKTFLFIVFILLSSIGLTASAGEFSPYVDKKGNISLPKNFELNMVHLGAWFVPSGGASGFHSVFTTKDAVEYFQNQGHFPDGAVLIKELRADIKKDYTTGSNVSFATDVKQWFVMVKDSKNRFNDHPNWGEGWGWALYKPDDPAKNLSTNYQTDCLGCHVPVKDKDWVYTEAYPVLFNK
ncbi:cytochrome P460 family protein [Gayadomonas joobiniege]|uniref:cytochrome P460 family protein n=1 Tax=Gayadomonas joobiniege TaxID=1234606 RepID=UPI0003788E10|nr:cytochrome P460 family protein [Gayadomonas joobiniege]